MSWIQQTFGQASPAEIAEIRTMFMQVDKDRSGQISYKELKGALSHGGQKFDSTIARQMVKMFDRSGTGQIDLNEFICLHKFITAARTIFFSLDTDRNQMLNVPEAQMAVTNFGLPLSPETFRSVMQRFDPERKGLVTFQEFMAMVVYLANIRGLHEFYDTDKDGWAAFTFDSMAAMGTFIHPGLEERYHVQQKKHKHHHRRR